MKPHPDSADATEGVAELERMRRVKNTRTPKDYGDNMSADDDWLHIEDAPTDDAINGDAEPTDDAASQFQAKMRQEFPRYTVPAKLRDELNATK